jgi:hypothetical protein
MKNKTLNIYYTYSVITPGVILARGGGGGSSSGGGGGGGGHSSSGSSHSSSSGSGIPLTGIQALILFSVFVGLFFILPIYLSIKNANKASKLKGKFASILNKNWFGETLEGTDPVAIRTKEIFFAFEKAWGEFDLPTLQRILTKDYYKRIVLELSVLQNEKRANPMEDLELYSISRFEGSQDSAAVRISAGATDILKDTGTGKILFKDVNDFAENWHLKNEDGELKLDFITQTTEDAAQTEPEIAAFAEKNNFYYDADFGWLMMPNKGVLFSSTDFGTSDINNHVIGYFHNKIVEFYTYITKSSLSNHLVAQAILPKTYNNILIKKKHFFEFPKRGLQKATLESVEFNKKFNVWAHPEDRINSLELLTPNFMEKIYNLPFELNIELVGNFLYLYTKDRGQANYDKMLEVLSWAFDEMKL